MGVWYIGIPQGASRPTQSVLMRLYRFQSFVCVLYDRGVLTCLLLAGGWPGIWLRSGGRRAGLVRAEKAPLLPPPHPYACGCLPQFFPHFS